MNLPKNSCLDETQLREFTAGRLADADRALIVQHLFGCPRCAELQRAIQLQVNSQSQADLSDPVTLIVTHPGQIPAPPGRSDSVDRPPADDVPFIFAKPESPDEIGRLGTYRILKELGRGGMGIVYEAEDTQLHRRVAIKVLRPDDFDAESKQRFLQEARIVASLSDPRIVTIYQIGEQGQYPYLVMELLHGESLETYLNRNKRLGTLESIRIVREVAQGLRAAHAKSLVHRDIKPGNVWLQKDTEGGEKPSVKILDFGIARSLLDGNSLTQKGSLIGTPSYMCPERARGLPVDQRSDIFSLGCLFYAMLTGTSPLERTNPLMSLRAAADAELESFDEKLSEIAPEVRNYIRRLLSRSPADRPQSVEQVCQDLNQLEDVVRNQRVIKTDFLPSVIGNPAKRAEQRFGWIQWTGVVVLVISAITGIAIEFGRVGPSPGKIASRDTGSDVMPKDSERSTPMAEVATPVTSAAPIRVGILISQSGPMSTSERPLLDAFLFAIDEINASGGLLNGRKVEYVNADGKSFPSEFAAQAEKLIRDDKVATLFGVWRSSCRIAVEKVCEDYGNLLVYPAAYEGLETSRAVIYMGGTANQQVTPSVRWARTDLRKRKFFLIGTEGLFSRAAHEVISDELSELGAQVVGNDFHEHGDPDFSNLVSQIRESDADIILNTLVGSDNIFFFSALRRGEFDTSKVPIISYNVTEQELRLISSKDYGLDGNYCASSYFQSLDNESNIEFKRRFLARYPAGIITDPVVAAYSGMRLWALAVQAAGSDEPQQICRVISSQKFQGPEGPVSIEPITQIARRKALIGKVTMHLEFEVVFTSPRPIDPEPYPSTRSRAAWIEFIRTTRELHQERWDR